MRRSSHLTSRRALSGREVFILVALAICVALVAIPWFLAKGRKRDRLASFQNLQQWGIALNLHLIDHNNQLPQVGSAPIGPQPGGAWYNTLPTYLSREPLGGQGEAARPQPGDGSIWFDPSAEPPRRASAGEFYFTYGMNRYLQPDPAQPSYSIFDLDTPGAIVFLTEKSGFSPGVMPPEVEFRHHKAEGGDARLAFVLFCDGHVSFGSQWEMQENPAALTPEKAIAPLSWVPYIGAPKPKAGETRAATEPSGPTL